MFNQTISHKSSFYLITIDYTVELFQARKILRIDLNFSNTSNSNLNEFKIKTQQLKTVLSIEPQNIILEYCKPR